MKPTNYISITLATLVMAFSVGCKKTDKPNTFLPSIKGGGTTGNGNESETGQGGKIGEEGGVTSTDGGEVGLTGLEDFENMLMDREAFAAQTVYFGFDRSEIEPGDTDNVNAVAEALSSSPQNKVLIEGHCDERGTEEYNRALGERRALSIRDILVEQGTRLLAKPVKEAAQKIVDATQDEEALVQQVRESGVGFKNMEQSNGIAH